MGLLRSLLSRTVYHVVPDGNEWAVKRENSRRASARFDTKADAINRARQLAKADKPSQVKVHGLNGQIQNEWTYGKDPSKYPS